MSTPFGTRHDRTSRIRYRTAVVLVSVAASVVVWIVVTIAGVRLDVTSPAVGTLTIDLLLVVVSALPLALAAWGVLALLERFGRRPRRTWTIVAVAVLVLSLPPLALLGATPATLIMLALMHLATGLVLILLLPRPARPVTVAVSDEAAS